jgi:type IV pilus assembly protein PilW
MMQHPAGVAGRHRLGGFTIVEMMVAMLVGMVVVLSITSVQKAFEGQRRTTTSSNDIDNAGAYVLSQLDGMLRSAGSGFTQAYTQTYGCQLNAANGGTTVLPSNAITAQAPFANFLTGIGGTVRMAPVLIVPANTPLAQLNSTSSSSDVLMIMAGAGYAANLQTALVAPAPTATTLNMESTAAFGANDLVLLMNPATPTGPAACSIEQVSSAFAPGAGVTALPLGGNYYATNPVSPATFLIGGAAVGIGNPAKGNFPVFQVVGVGAGNQLYSYDLLNLQGLNPQVPLPIGDSVMELHAKYLTTVTGGNGFVGIDPSTGNFAPAQLMNGSSLASTNLNSIKAVRIGLILKSPLMEKLNAGVHVAPAQIQLFSDLADANGNPLTYTRTLSSTNCSNTDPVTSCELDYRYRAVELTVPLRNPIIN